jgi:phasin family protein
MADTNTHNAAPKADTPAQAVAKAADAMPKAAERAAPAPLKEVAKAAATVAAAPAKAAAEAAKSAPAARTASTRTAKKPARAKAARAATARATAARAKTANAKAAPARRAAASKNSAPKRSAAPAAAAATARAAANTSKTINANLNEGNRNMKNETRQVADRFQAVFGDVNERAKTAMERNSRVAEELTELTKGNVEAMVASTKVAAKGVETLGQEIAEFSRKSFEETSAALKGIADVKSPTDFFRLQSDFARSQFDLMVAETSKLSETMIKLAGQAAEPISGRYTVAVERVRTAVAA